jgi:hypothetical protein
MAGIPFWENEASSEPKPPPARERAFKQEVGIALAGLGKFDDSLGDDPR